MGVIRMTWNILSILITVIFVIALIWFVLYPTPIKYVLQCFVPKTEYEPNANYTTVKNYILYTNAKSNHTKLIVIIPGGAGLLNSIANIYGFMNKLNETLGDDYDILTFSYPVRFKHTIRDSMLRVNEVLSDFTHYEEIHGIGLSFGSLLLGAFNNKESNILSSQQMQVPQIGIKFKTFTGICGMYQPFFNVKLLTWLFDFYIMRGTPGIKLYSCYGMPIPKLIITSNSDFLVSQSTKFLQSENAESLSYPTANLPHTFPQYINLPEAQQSIVKIVDFIKQNSN
ncbi:ACH96177.1 GrBNV gp19-like protein [Kallithea virus]|uniref:ACH96177.1 GrBNV gp19-like protein n=1 Tax=Kallithea virus TaxID=1654582 RepID=A0A0F7KNK5_9VIRU|nr:ACH96177.1 GrBNV gp19-like protein [Kallithea virus]AKH40367.1 putative gp19-like protein [Kallithea virus]AQN78591.1 ACH96177.1 GrBNV gp19-like protein [Kallithea virus]